MADSSRPPYRFSIHATANARHAGVGGAHDGALRVAVTVAADKGKANKAILKLLATSLALRRGQLALVAGATSRRKTVEVQEPPDDLPARIRALAAS